MTGRHAREPGRQRRALLAPALALAGAIAIALGAQVDVPMQPVPMTLQTLAVLLVAGLGGPGLGAAAALLYLAAAAAGAPVLAGGESAGGAAFLDLPSAGYVVAFIPGAALAGLAPRRFFPGLLGMLAAHGVILALGALWLARSLGAAGAVEHGVAPFLVGAALKSALASLVVVLAGLRRPESEALA